MLLVLTIKYFCESTELLPVKQYFSDIIFCTVSGKLLKESNIKWTIIFVDCVIEYSQDKM